MDFIITDNLGREEAYLLHNGIDIDVGVDNDFEIEVDLNSFDPVIHSENCRFFCPGTEYGGIIKTIEPVTSVNTLKLGGSIWRGKLGQIALEPPVGENYRYLNGEAHTVIEGLITELGLSNLFAVSSTDSGIVFENYKVPLQSQLFQALWDALTEKGAKISLAYKEGEPNGVGYVLISVVQIIDYSEIMELSQDENINIDLVDYRNGVNHLICLGKGELSERNRVDLYAWPDGTIQKTPYYTGVDKIEAYYEYSSAEDAAVLEEYGRKRLKEEMNYIQMKASVENLEHIEIGDIVSGRERITGKKIKKPIVQKIIQVSGNGVAKITPKLKGED